MTHVDEVKILEETAPPAKLRAYTVAVLIAAGGIAFFFGLGRLALTGPDEPRYAEVAREMFATGDYITPRLAGCLWFEKPALLYWMAASAYGLFGVDEFAARFPSALTALIAVLFTYYALSRAVSHSLGLVSALALATCGLFIGYARAATTDMVMAAMMTVAFLSAFLFSVTGRRWQWILCWAAVGAAVLAKGLVAIVFAIAILVIYFFIAGQLKTIGWRRWLVGLAVMTAVAALWYGPVTAKHGWEFINKFIIEHHFERYLTEKHAHPQPVYYYLLVAPAGLLPWTFFLIPAIGRIRRLRLREDRRDRLAAFAWVWAGVMMIFFSFSGSKLPGYILPAMPALVIIVGLEIERVWREERGRVLEAALWLTALLVVAIGAALAIYLRREAISIIGLQWALYLMSIAVGLTAVFLLAFRRRRAFIMAGAATVLAAVMAAAILLLPVMSERLALKTLSLRAAAQLREGERICFFVMKEFAPVFYAEGRVVCRPGKGSALNALNTGTLTRALEEESSIIVFTTRNWVDELESEERFAVEFIDGQGEAVALRVTLKR
ncbi:MAG: glycosyltransferase family 39 protein [Acidobacteriota bacterium]